MTVDFYAGLPHYADHLGPIWEALDPDLRGRFVSTRQVQRTTPWPVEVGSPPTRAEGPVVVAGGMELRAFRGRPTCLVEHGAGQSYVGVDHESYSGGRGREHVELFLVPNERVAERCGGRAEVVGSPWVEHLRRQARGEAGEAIGATFHWDCAVVPEARSALSLYAPAVARLGTVVATSHPRHARQHARAWRRLGVSHEARLEGLVRRCCLLVADNTSAMYEWAALDRPVVVLDAPWYRRDVEHGLRFWEMADVGVRCPSPEALVPAVERALDEAAEVVERRREIVDAVYGEVDGSARRAADAVAAWALGRHSRGRADHAARGG
jgi:hypothetical protein